MVKEHIILNGEVINNEGIYRSLHKETINVRGHKMVMMVINYKDIKHKVTRGVIGTDIEDKEGVTIDVINIEKYQKDTEILGVNENDRDKYIELSLNITLRTGGEELESENLSEEIQRLKLEIKRLIEESQ